MKKVILLLIVLSTLASCAKKEPFLIINGERIPDGELQYIYFTLISQYELYNNTVIDWAKPIEGVDSKRYFLEEAKRLVTEYHVTLLKAAEYGVEIDGAEKVELDDLIAYEKENAGGDEAFNRLLITLGGDERTYRAYMHEFQRLTDKLKKNIFGESGAYAVTENAVKSFYNDNYTNAAYLCITLTGDDYLPLSQSEQERQRAIADTLLRRIKDGEDFYAIIAEFGNDYAMAANPQGFPVERGTFGSAFDETLDSLSVLSVSEVIQSDDALFIIKKLPPDDTYFNECNDDIRMDYENTIYSNLLDTWCESAEVIVSEKYYNVDWK